MKKTSDTLDVNYVIQDIFADKSTFESKFRKYEKIKEDLDNESQNHIYNNYKTFIKITDELKNVQGSVEKMKSYFLEYEPLLNSLRNTLKDEELERQAKKKTTAINRTIFDFNESDEKDDLDTNEVMEDVKKASNEKSSLNSRNTYDLTDQVNDVIDKFDLSIYERSYTESIKIYRLFKAMKNSKKYSEIIVSYDVRKNIDFHYNRLVESLISDIFNETTKNLNEIIKYLIEIGQLHKAKIAVLNTKSKETERKLKTLIDDNRVHDDAFFESLAKEFVDSALSCLKFIKETFREPNQGNSVMSSFSTWLVSEVQTFYSTVAPFIFESDDIELAIYYIKRICIAFMERQGEGISLSTDFQKIALSDVQELLEELSETLIFNLKTSVSGEDYSLYSFFQIFNVLEYSIEIIETASMIDINKRIDPRRSSNQRAAAAEKTLEASDASFAGESERFLDNLSESMVDSKTFEILILTEIGLKFTRSMNYFWNCFFYLIDLAYSVKDTDNIPVLSSQFFCLVQVKLESLYENLLKVYFEVLDEKVSKTENQALSFLTSLFYSRLLAENMDKLLQFKFSKMYKKNSSWQAFASILAKKYDEAMSVYTKMALLDKVAPAIVRNAPIYTKKETKIVVEKPTINFTGLAEAIEKSNETLEFLLGPKHRERALYRMLYSCFLCIEYTVLCLQSVRTDESPTPLFDKAVLERFRIDHEGIQMLLYRNQFKITDCTAAGLYQFIFDVNFLSVFYGRLVPSVESNQDKKHINTDNLLERMIMIFAKEKSIKAENIKFKKEIFKPALEEFLDKGYEDQKKSLAQSK